MSAVPRLVEPQGVEQLLLVEERQKPDPPAQKGFAVTIPFAPPEAICFPSGL